MRRILATDFGIWPTFGDIRHSSDRMVAAPEYWSRIANYVLLYDQTVIPTGNLQILPVLRLILGESVFDELVRNKGIVFARFDQWFAYQGGGGGLVFFTIGENPNLPTRGPNMGHAYFKPLDEAIDVALQITLPPSSPQRRNEIKNLLLDNVVKLPTAQIAEGLKEEAYNDISGSPYLRDFLSLRNAGRSLDNLVGINPDQITIFDPHGAKEGPQVPEVQSVLRVAFENFLLSVGGKVDVTEITSDDSTLAVLQAKGQRLGFLPKGKNAFAQIQKVSGVPDIGEAFAAKRISSNQILDLRHSKHCQALRDWFAQGTPGESAEETLRRYVEEIGRPSWIESIPAKLLRFAVTTGIGVVEPITGAVASAADSFLLSKCFPGRSPRLFMKQAKVMLSHTPVIQNPTMKGRDRNGPCSCGSGKKLKKCCGR
jgi:hypothetical protein